MLLIITQKFCKVEEKGSLFELILFAGRLNYIINELKLI